MKCYTIFLGILFSVFYASNAQEKNERKWNLAIGYSWINNCTLSDFNIGELSIEGNYKINKWIETGVYAGYSICMSERETRISDTEYSGSYRISQVVSYGGNFYLHLLPLVFEKDTRLGVRVIMKPGDAVIITKEKGAKPRGHHFTFRAGVGMDYRLFRKMGIFGEYVYGFGDGVYRARGKYGDPVEGEKHIGSFRFGIQVPL
jgi:hypothetical protein